MNLNFGLFIKTDQRPLQIQLQQRTYSLLHHRKGFYILLIILEPSLSFFDSILLYYCVATWARKET